MPGFDRSRVVDLSDEDLNEFTCGICQDIFVKPVVTQCCRQTYCRECIEEWLKVNNTCPTDRKILSDRNLLDPPRLVINLLNKMKVKCDYHSYGCDLIVTIDELTKHTNECLKNPNRICVVCGFETDGHEEHECVANLKITNMSITQEMNRLIDENKALKLENQQLRRPNAPTINPPVPRRPPIQMVAQKIIESARNRIDQFVVVEDQGSILRPVFHQCIEKSKFAINNFNSYQEIAEYLSNYLNSDNNQGEYWNVTVATSDGAWSIVYKEKYLRLQFGGLKIILYTAP